MNLVYGSVCHESLVAQWLGHPTGVRRVIGSNPVGDLEYFWSHVRDIEDITWRCGDKKKISLWVLKNISRVSAANELNIFAHKKRNFVSPSSHVMSHLLYKHQWNTKPFYSCCSRRDLLCNHSNGDLFTREDIIFLHKSSPSISLVFT